MAEAALRSFQTYLQSIESRLAAVENSNGSPSTTTAASSSTSTLSSGVKASAAAASSPSLLAYEKYKTSFLTPFLSSCKALAPEIDDLGSIVSLAFDAHGSVLQTAAACKKPSNQAAWKPLLQGLQDCIKQMNAKRDNRSNWSNHQNMLNEGIQALGWLCVEPAPVPFIESYIGGADFWGNKIRVAFKTTEPAQVAFVTSFRTLLLELINFVKEHHKTGVQWNSQGADVSSYDSAPVTTTAAEKPATKPAGNNMNSVFAGIQAIDQSSGKTAGLKTVTKDMQTWRKEYKSDGSKVVQPKSSTGGAAAGTRVAKGPTKPAVCELRADKWVVEYQGGEGAEPVTVSGIVMKQQVYIYGCVNATIVLEGKAKTIVLDNCKSTKLVFDSAVSSAEVVNCAKVQIQCKGKCPSIAIDKTDGCLVYLSWEGKDGTDLITSKSSEMNVAFPTSDSSDADYKEVPIPEQFVHKITADSGISSEVSELYS